jgi:hypothetical protein
MDGPRFETLTRSFSAPRRTYLLAILGGAFGLALLAVAGCK